MGNASYSVNSRVESGRSAFYAKATVDQIFEQNAKREMHADMNPNGVAFRESRDSEAHPSAIPLALFLDVTGSMGRIPHELIKTGLPTLMGTLIQNGVPDLALMFGAIGDHECDQCPLQVGQFESGDAELDLWLTRTYLEGRGGGNAGESYALAWYFAANHVKTDALDKRGKKGFVITIGDEPCLPTYPLSSIKSIMGNTAIGQDTYTSAQLLDAAQKKNHVYHIHINHDGRLAGAAWKQMLGKNLIEITDYTTVARVISDIILDEIKLGKPEAQKATVDVDKHENLL